MCTLILTLAMLVVSTGAHAVVSDRFKCDIMIVEDGTGESTSQEFEFHLARLPLSRSPAPDVRLSAAFADGRVKMRNSRSEIRANLTFDYQHGMKVDSTGHVVEARQQTCLLLSAQWCDLTSSSEGGIRICAESKMACQGTADPFDSSGGWPVVGVAPDQETVLFDEKALIPYSTTFQDSSGVVRGTATVSCQYKGTYQ